MLSRLKFDIKQLVNEMLDRLPADVWTRTDTTFLDPAMAGGQFIVEIIARLTAAGHSEDNIASRVFGLADSPLSLMFTQNKYKIRGQFSVGGIETLEQWVMASKKFDVVIGNPPYQDGEAAEGRKTATKPLWFDFSELAFKLVNADGTVAYITPSSWLLKTSKAHDIITSHEVYAKVFSKTPFRGVGTTVSYWIASATTNTTGTISLSTDIDATDMVVNLSGFMPVGADAFSLKVDILQKTLNAAAKKMDVRSTMQHHTLSHKDRLSTSKTKAHQYPVFHNNSTTLYSSMKDDLHSLHKVLISKTGSIMKARVDQDSSVSQIAMALVTSSASEANVALAVLQSKLYRFMLDCIRTNATIPSDVWRNLPAVDLTRSWTDAELYAHFNLTQEEIDLIEATVK